MRNSNGHLKKLNEELRSNLKLARDSAESANRLKTAFLANMSHEIRTPLGAILGFTELLRDHDVADEEKRLYIDTIQRNGSALARLIDDILDLSKIEADRLELEKVAFSLPALINEITSLFAARAERAGIPLIVSFDQRVPTQIISDPTRIRQILINLIGNALKFTEHGEIMLKIAPIEDAAGNIQFSVEDSGVGIPIERQSGLFQPFVQADCSTTRKFGGTGLGLFLSKRLAQALGGDVRLTHSEPGVGSKFVLMLACGTAEAEKASQSHGKGAHPAPMQRLKGSRILLVEDTIDNQLLVGRILKRQGAELEFASDGKAGVDKALAGKFDIVLMDLQMPEMDGFEALNTLRENGFTKPIVALTAHAMKEERRHALASGFAEHVAKPVNSSELISVLESFLTTNV